MSIIALHDAPFGLPMCKSLQVLTEVVCAELPNAAEGFGWVIRAPHPNNNAPDKRTCLGPRNKGYENGSQVSHEPSSITPTRIADQVNQRCTGANNIDYSLPCPAIPINTAHRIVGTVDVPVEPISGWVGRAAAPRLRVSGFSCLRVWRPLLPTGMPVSCPC